MKKGFTLLEVVIALLIVGIVATSALPALASLNKGSLNAELAYATPGIAQSFLSGQNTSNSYAKIFGINSLTRTNQISSSSGILFVNSVVTKANTQNSSYIKGLTALKSSIGQPDTVWSGGSSSGSGGSGGSSTPIITSSFISGVFAAQSNGISYPINFSSMNTPSGVISSASTAVTGFMNNIQQTLAQTFNQYGIFGGVANYTASVLASTIDSYFNLQSKLTNYLGAKGAPSLPNVYSGIFGNSIPDNVLGSVVGSVCNVLDGVPLVGSDLAKDFQSWSSGFYIQAFPFTSTQSLSVTIPSGINSVDLRVVALGWVPGQNSLNTSFGVTMSSTTISLTQGSTLVLTATAGGLSGLQGIALIYVKPNNTNNTLSFIQSTPDVYSPQSYTLDTTYASGSNFSGWQSVSLDIALNTKVTVNIWPWSSNGIYTTQPLYSFTLYGPNSGAQVPLSPLNFGKQDLHIVATVEPIIKSLPASISNVSVNYYKSSQ